MHHNGLGFGDESFPLFRVTLDDLIGVEFIGHGRHAQVGLQTGFVVQQATRVEANLILAVEGLARRFQPAQDGFLPGSIRVEGEHDAAGEFLEQPQLVFGERCAHRRDSVLEPGLVDGDHVEVAFHDDGLVGCPDGFARPVQPVEQAALAEERRLGRVHELGDIVRVEDARPEAGILAVLVADGDHQAVVEAVHEPAGFTL